MVRGSAVRRFVGVVLSGLPVAMLAMAAPTARAFEYLDGRIQVHGYFEETVRAISENFNDSLDLTQWYHTLHIETDIDIAKDGWGPFDSVGAYIGVEVRYDCVWTRACGFSPSVDVYGNRSEHLPSRLSDSQDPRLAGTYRYQNPIVRQPDRNIEITKFYPGNVSTPPPAGGPFPTTPTPPAGPRLDPTTLVTRSVSQATPYSALLGTRVALGLGPLGPAATGGPPFIDYFPGQYTFQRYLTYGFALRNVRTGEDGFGTQTMPWDPKDDVDPQGTLADRASPFRPLDRNPITNIAGQDLPFRPGPRFGPLGAPNSYTANGLFVPSRPYANYLRDGGSDQFDQNFSQDELAWNRGASQQQTKELKEAYLELEMLGGALFLRLGRQTIVYGKTELFATTDLFNPNDLALGSLTSLEESRIPIWAARAIYSFYEVGPVSDVRLEVALDLDDFYPVDLGRCGEAYTPNPVCDKTNGLIVHGTTGVGLAGENRPPMWWDSAEGLQGAVRLEFRWDRFSFALVDFYNYTKFPYADRLTTFSRNVDPITGRPRQYGATGSCVTGAEPACVTGGNDYLVNASLNQTLYAAVCSSTVGFSSLDRSSCAQSVLTSPSNAAPGVSVANLVSQLVAGSPNGINTTIAFTSTAGRIPLVSLSIDAGDGTPTGIFGPFATNPAFNFALPGFAANHNNFQTLAQTMTTQQQALLGCGPFYGTTCDGGPDSIGSASGGIDLLNAEASALVQSWSGFEGGGPTGGITANNAAVAQPGTIGYQGGPTCTRVLSNGQQVILPGCRGPQDPGYDPAVDGPNPGVTSIGFPAGVSGVPALGAAALGPIAFTQGHPFTGQTWRSEMAALSWNLQMVLVAFSSLQTAAKTAGDPNSDPTLRFDVNNPYRTDGCSYVIPWKCSSVSAFWGVTGVTRNTVNAGGNGRFGRRDMAWATGGDVLLKYQKRNVLGFSADFAEDYTKTNWGTEFTWVRKQPFTDQDQFVGYNKTDAFNLTISVDRPTFINFLNQSRTFFFNSQMFFSYVPGYHNSFIADGPWNAFFTFTTQTGYFQDRLLPGMTWVYDTQSNSGAALPNITYRFTESFSATFGFALFWGRYDDRDLAINPVGPSNQAGNYAYRTWIENGLSVIRDRDEVYMRIRYTF